MKQLMHRYPASSSRKTMFHGIQCYRADKFQHFDYGRKKNLKMYGQSKPPPYELGKVNIPTALFHSTGDKLCTKIVSRMFSVTF
jgi:lysosomal acid lipase/cholesteryl ester hydrolase